MILKELFYQEDATPFKKKLGRTFNHLEDLVFFHNSAGALEALNHIQEVSSDSSSMRMKWDGNPQIYIGREFVGGPLILAGHNAWARGAKSANSADVYDFIANKSGSPKTPEEKQSREQFAKQFASLYQLFDAATPNDFVGFVYGDALFLQQPELDEKGVYNFYPNPKSKTGYHVLRESTLGQRISNSNVMIVGHATFNQFGADDSLQTPKDDFSEFNRNSQLIVLSPYYTPAQATVDANEIVSIEKYLKTHSIEIDEFLSPLVGVSGLKDMMYRYVNTMSKQKQLKNIGTNFVNWINTSGVVSSNQQKKIHSRIAQFPNALSAIFKLITDIMALKDSVIDQLDRAPGEVAASNSEGWVRYADTNKKFGNVKFVPRHRWTP